MLHTGAYRLKKTFLFKFILEQMQNDSFLWNLLHSTIRHSSMIVYDEPSNTHTHILRSIHYIDEDVDRRRKTPARGNPHEHKNLTLTAKSTGY